MISDFLKNSVIYGIGKFIALFFGFLTIPIITSALSPEEYGIFDLLNLCLLLLNLTVAMEISQAVIRFMLETKDLEEKRNLVSTAYFFSLMMFTICGLFLYVFQLPLSFFIFNSPAYPELIVYLVPWLFLHGTNSFILNQFRWENKPKIQVILQSCMSISLLVTVFYFLKYNHPSVETLFYAYFVSQMGTMILGFFFILNNRLINFSFSFSKLKMMLFFSFPLIPSSIAVFAQNYIDRVMISQMLDMNALGIYSLAFKIAGLLGVFSGIFHLSIVPLIYKHCNDNSASKNFGEAAHIFLFFILSFVVGIVLFLPELFHLFIGKEFFSSMKIIPWLLFAVGLQSFYVFAPGLAIEKKTYIIACLNIFGMSVNAALNIILIRYMGIEGAAIATSVSALIMCILNVMIGQKYYFVQYDYKIIIPSVVLVILIIFLLKQMIVEISVSFFIFKFFVAFGTIITLLFLLIPKNIRSAGLEKVKIF